LAQAINHIKYISYCTFYLYRENTCTCTILSTILHAIYKHISFINITTCTMYYITNNNFQFCSFCKTHYIYIIVSYFIFADLYSLHIHITILYPAYIIYMFHCLTCTRMLIAISEMKLIACRNNYCSQGYLYIKNYSIHVTVTLHTVLIMLIIIISYFPDHYIAASFGKLTMQKNIHALLYLKNNELHKYIIMTLYVTSAIHRSNNSMFGTLIYNYSRFKWSLPIHMIVMIYSIIYRLVVVLHVYPLTQRQARYHVVNNNMYECTKSCTFTFHMDI